MSMSIKNILKAILLLPILFFYQNCGGNFDSSTFNSQSLSSEGRLSPEENVEQNQSEMVVDPPEVRTPSVETPVIETPPLPPEVAPLDKEPKDDEIVSDNELFHKTDFLTAGHFTHLYPGYGKDRRTAIIKSLKDRGYTHIYIYVMNQNDYRGPKFNYYNDPKGYKSILQELIAAGLYPVVWLAPDDAPTLHKNLPPKTLRNKWLSFIPQIETESSSFVLGLEMDEYWSSTEQSYLGSELRKITKRPIFVHMTKGKWEPVLEPWADGLVYQYGFDKTEKEIQQDTIKVLNEVTKIGKVFIAGEYNVAGGEKLSINLGDSAMASGAHGFGNGASLSIEQPQTTNPSNKEATGLVPADFLLSKVKWHNVKPDISQFKVTSQLTSVTIKPGQICTYYDKAGKWGGKLTISGGAEVQANPWVIVKIGNQWIGGSYEWLRTGGQQCKTLGSKPPQTTVYDELPTHIKGAPFLNSNGSVAWLPKSGDIIGFMVSSLARGGTDSKVAIKERTQIHFVKLP